MISIKNQIALITGASTGIGRSIAELFAAEGAICILAARSEQKLKELETSIKEKGGKAVAIPTDVTDEASVIALFDAIRSQYGRLDILVNNAGISAGGPIDEMPLSEWQQVIDVNLTGVFLCSKEAFKFMKPQKFGRIVNIGSVSARMPRQNSAPYTTTKFGLDGLTRSLALDGRPFGISASVIHPGNTYTPIWDGREEVIGEEGGMSADDLASVILTMVSLPPEVNMLESIILPVSMPFIGRG